MKVISGSHALLTSIVLAWNTAQMQSVVDRLRKEGQVIEDGWLRRRGPCVGLRESEGTRSPCTQVAGRAKVESAADFQISSSNTAPILTQRAPTLLRSSKGSITLEMPVFAHLGSFSTTCCT